MISCFFFFCHSRPLSFAIPHLLLTGIGNIWRFPYVIASNGGAAALFAYLVCAVLVAVLLFLYELIIGQSIRLSTIRCYEMIHPRWKSLGYASGAMLFMVLSYYGQIVAYTLPYIMDSCKDPLPWVTKGAENHWRFGILEGYADGEEKNGLGGIVPRLAISLLCFWIITLLSASFGSEILSKITYVTVSPAQNVLVSDITSDISLTNSFLSARSK